jgi:outer membrane protein assembly factor BamB
MHFYRSGICRWLRSNRILGCISLVPLALAASCENGPERAVRKFFSSLRDKDTEALIGCLSDSTILTANSFLDVLRDSSGAGCYLISRCWETPVDEQRLASWTGESLLVASLHSGRMSLLATGDELEYTTLGSGDSIAVLASSSVDCDTLFCTRAPRGWRVTLSLSEFSFSPDQVLDSFLAATAEGKGVVASSLLDPVCVNSLSELFSQLKTDLDASSFLGQHGIQLSQQDLIACTTKRYLELYLSAAGTSQGIGSLPDSTIVHLIHATDSAQVTAFFHAEERVATLRRYNGLWLISFASDHLPLAPMTETPQGLSSIWSRVIPSESWLWQTMPGQCLVVAGRTGSDNNSQEFVAGINYLTGSMEWRRTDQGSSLLGVSPDSTQFYAVDQTGRIICASSETGDVRWAHEVEDGYWASHLLDTGREVIISLEAQIYSVPELQSEIACLDRDSGEDLWRFTLPRRCITYYTNPEGSADGPWESCTSQLVASDGSIFLATSGSNLYRIDMTTGEQVWRNYTRGVVTGEIALVDSSLVLPGGGEWGWGSAFIGGVPGDKHLYCLSTEDGSRRWYYTSGSPLDDIQIEPYEGILLFHSVPTACPGTPVVCLDRSTGEELWTYPSSTESDQSSVISMATHCGTLFLSTSTSLSALEMASGVLLWSVPEQDLWDLCFSGDRLFAKRVTAYSYIYERWGNRPDYSAAYPSYDGKAGLVCIDPTTGAVVWEVAEAVNNSEGILPGQDVIFVRVADTLSCYSNWPDGSIPIDLWN